MRKKSLLSVSLAAMLVMLSACGGGDATANSEPATRTAEAATQTAEAGTEATAEVSANAEEHKEQAAVTRDAGGLGGDKAESDLPFYVGDWRFDGYAIYLSIGDDSRWSAYNASGKVTHSGDYYDNGDGLTMSYDDGSDDNTYTFTDNGLKDEDGNTLSKVDKMIFLPTKDDPLNETYYFDTNFKDVSVNYPDTLTTYKREGMKDTVLFSPTVGAKTGDARCSIQIPHEQLTGKQRKLQCGSGPAKGVMVNLLNNVLEHHYKKYLLKTISTDFKDCGTYYSITGYTWFDSNIFENNDGKLYRGVCQMRYYGPTGYFVAIITIGTPERIDEYYELSQKIMDTYSYKSDWNTSPKTVPSKPGKPSGKNGSDPGDYGTAYYWTDADGDIWYWNGSYNEFISYGSNGYIDDGQYYESNDAGWDDEDYYEDNDAGWNYYDDYDIYSDPGDGYDSWSDPGDYEEYSGWDDY